MVNIKLKEGVSLSPLKSLMAGKNRIEMMRSLRNNPFLPYEFSELLVFMLDKINDVKILIQETKSVHKKVELLKLYEYLEKLMKLMEAIVKNNISSGEIMN